MAFMKTHLIIAACLGLASIAVAEKSASAERRTNDLSKQAAVRHRRLLVKGRFEFTPLFESTINADFRHIIGGGAKLEYHVGDMLSFGVVGVASASINTALVNKVVGTLGTTDTGDSTPEPTKDQYLQHLNSMPFHGAAYV